MPGAAAGRRKLLEGGPAEALKPSQVPGPAFKFKLKLLAAEPGLSPSHVLVTSLTRDGAWQIL